jgi:peroxiredoxin
MAQLRRDSDEYDKRGVRILGVVVQKVQRLKAYLASHPMPFPLLADQEREVAKAYGVYVAFNYESFRIARPATFVIDPSGIIRFIHVGRTQFDRPSTALVFKALDTLVPRKLAGTP